MAFTLPELPYSYDALAPYMSAETLEFHHDKHHQAYVTKANELIAGTGLENMSLEEAMVAAYKDKSKAGLFNQLGQHFNHIHFWHWMKKGGGGNKLFNPYNDFKKIDVGLTGGLQYKLNVGKKDLGGIIGIRANLGLANIDNLYDRDCPTPSLCNGRVSFLGASAYYSVNLLKL